MYYLKTSLKTSYSWCFFWLVSGRIWNSWGHHINLGHRFSQELCFRGRVRRAENGTVRVAQKLWGTSTGRFLPPERMGFWGILKLPESSSSGNALNGPLHSYCWGSISICTRFCISSVTSKEPLDTSWEFFFFGGFKRNI